jgi:hypothetical protein
MKKKDAIKQKAKLDEELFRQKEETKKKEIEEKKKI